MSAATKQPLDQRLVKAVGHPLRAQLLAILNERVASPNELAKELGEPLGNVSYHIRLLADLECVELVDTKPRRGAVEHYYQATVPPWFDKRTWKKVPKSLRGSLSGSMVQLVLDEAAAALKSGAFDSRADRHVSRTSLMLDEEGWKELAASIDELLERALELKAQSADRAVAAGSEDELIPCTLALLHFPTS